VFVHGQLDVELELSLYKGSPMTIQI